MLTSLDLFRGKVDYSVGSQVVEQIMRQANAQAHEEQVSDLVWTKGWVVSRSALYNYLLDMYSPAI